MVGFFRSVNDMFWGFLFLGCYFDMLVLLIKLGWPLISFWGHLSDPFCLLKVLLAMSAVGYWVWEKRIQNSSRKRVYLLCKAKVHLKIWVGCLECCLGLLETKSQRPKKWASWAVCTQETSYRGKRGPQRQVQGVRPGHAVAAHCPSGCKFCGNP